MPQRTDIFDLGRLGLTSGEGRRLELHTAPRPASSSGAERYAVEPELDPGAARRLAHDRQRLGAAAALRARARRPVHALPRAGAADFEVDAREVHQPGGGEELSSPYVDADEELDLAGWARDALALALPAQLICRADCAGLCRQCGANLNEDPEHTHEPEPDTALGEALRAEVRLGAGRGGALRYPSGPPMAVPKQKQSHARTNQRRVAAQDHRAGDQQRARSATPAPSASGLPELRHLRRPRGRPRARRPARPRPRPLDRPPAVPGGRVLTVAVDANGADLGPAEVARGAAEAAARGVRVLLFGPAARGRRARRRASRSSTRRSRSPRPPTRPARSARPPTPRSCRAVEAVADGDADALVSGGSTGAALAASLFGFKRARGIHRPALAVVVPVPGRAVPAARRGRQRRGPARAPRPVRPHGRGLHGGRHGHGAPARGAALQRRGARQGQRGRRRRPRRAGRGAGRAG